MFIIFDLDGTLANIEHRLHYINPEPNKKKDWGAFNRACINDKPITPIVNIFRILSMAHYIEIWSGRNKAVWNETQDWLKENKIIPERLKMREDGDFTPDHILKEYWLKESIARNHKPELVFDDRSRLVQMWRSHGIQCCQVAEGEF